MTSAGRNVVEREGGLPPNVSAATGQSSAFFSAPGTPWAYSGAAIMIATLAPTSSRRVSTGSGFGSR